MLHGVYLIPECKKQKPHLLENTLKATEAARGSEDAVDVPRTDQAMYAL